MNAGIHRDLAAATIAAAAALLAEVILASIFGASDADARRFFLANAALERHERY